MLPTLMPAIASCRKRVRLIARRVSSSRRRGPSDVACTTLDSRLRGNDEVDRRASRLLVPTEYVALPRARPLHRFPLTVLHHHGHECEIADVVLGRERPRRGDRAHAVVLDAFQRTDHCVRGKVLACPL